MFSVVDDATGCGWSHLQQAGLEVHIQQGQLLDSLQAVRLHWVIWDSAIRQ